MQGNGRQDIILEIEGLKKRYGDHEVLRGIDLTAAKGSITAIIGSNGCGKSTLLRCTNLLEGYDEGRVQLRQQEISRGGPLTNGQSEESHASRVRQRIGMVFQHIHLFPHLSVIQNVMIGPQRVLKKSKREAAEIAEGLLDKVGLRAKGNADPSTLSGGQQQRVGIARALAVGPDVLLFDEATSALDPGASKEVFEVVDRLADEDGTTMLIVTHDMGFAFSSTPDELVFMKSGRIERKGAPSTLATDPLVRDFVGR